MITDTPPSNSETLQRQSRVFFYSRRKLEAFVTNNVKFYRRQCKNLRQRSLKAAKKCLDRCGATRVNWEQYCLAPLVSSLERLACYLSAGIELQLCNFEQEVARMLTPPLPPEDSCSSDPRCGVSAWLLIFENLKHKIIKNIGDGSFKVVSKCEWPQPVFLTAENVQDGH